ncbi:MAG TPA: ABC transporter permease [Gemmatimonadaceae bacterium]|nr:ABC transporter permease [Gemmatimonadaceae bacterium]
MSNDGSPESATRNGARLSVRWARWIFQRMARLALPASLHEEYGEEMRSAFATMAARAWETGGTLGVLRVLVLACMDLVRRAPAERDARRHAAGWPAPERGSAMTTAVRTLVHEARLAARSLAKRPAFTFVAAATLALGIGANVAIFTVVDSVLIRPLPYPRSDELVTIQHHAPGINLPTVENSAGTIELYKRFGRAFQELGAYTVDAQNLTGDIVPVRVQVLHVTPSLLHVLGVRAALGRVFAADDSAAGAPPVAMLTYTAWQSNFGGSRDVVGRRVHLNGVSTEIVGILPEHFVFPQRPKVHLILPLSIDQKDGFGAFGTRVIARLAPGADVAAAQREATALQPRITELFPDVTPDLLKRIGWSASVTSLRDAVVGDARTTLWVVMGAVGFLLLVACASVANLFLVRAEGRTRDVGVRLALGASARDIAAMHLSESLLLATVGGAWGLVVAYVAVHAIVAAGPANLPRLEDVRIDTTVIAFTVLVSVAAGVLFGVLPMRLRLRQPMSGLLSDGRGRTAGRDRQRLRKGMIVAQIALALMLLTGSGMLLRSFIRLRAADPGIEPQDAAAIGVSLGENPALASDPAGRTAEHAKQAIVYQRIMREVGQLPGVRAVGATNALPLDPEAMNGASLRIRSRPQADSAIPRVAMYVGVAGDYLQAIGTRVLRGRALDWSDVDHARPVALVNRTFEHQFLNDNALGEQIRFGDDSTWLTIVGIAEDVHTISIRNDVTPLAYLPITASVHGLHIATMQIVVRTSGEAASVVPTVRNAVRSAYPEVPITSARTMESVVDASMADTSFTVAILTIAAVVSLLLGAIGLYGVIGYVVTQRTREFGIRIALGAAPHAVRRMVLRQGLVLAGIGIVLGLAGAAAVTRSLRSLLYGVTTTDPVSFVVGSVVLVTVAAIAAYLPALRASAVSPSRALSEE